MRVDILTNGYRLINDIQVASFYSRMKNSAFFCKGQIFWLMRKGLRQFPPLGDGAPRREKIKNAIGTVIPDAGRIDLKIYLAISNFGI